MSLYTDEEWQSHEKSINRFKVAMVELGYKKNTDCATDTYGKKNKNINFLYSLISFTHTINIGYSIDWNLLVKINDKVFGEISICGLINFVLTNDEKIIYELERRWSDNQLKYAWKDSQFEEMINFIVLVDEALSKKYDDIDHIINEYEMQQEYEKKLWLEAGKKYPEISQKYTNLSMLYYLFEDYNNAIKMEEKALLSNSSYFDENHYVILENKAHINYFKNGTPLPEIKYPMDETSVFEPIGKDIYIAINKKAIKDEDVLEYFGGKDSFEKGEKISFEDVPNSQGLSIIKVGKWCVVKCDFEILSSFEQNSWEESLKKLSSLYKRVVVFTNEDTTNTFGFEVFKQGELIRRWMASEGQVLENIGKAITGEKKRFLEQQSDANDELEVIDFLNSMMKVTYAELETCKVVNYLRK
jgi:tetratricopeptide (TPR) repeat protein